MSSFGTMTTIQRIEQVGPEEPLPGLVFRTTTVLSLFGVPLTLGASAHKTELHIDDHGLTAVGELGGLRAGTLYLPWSRVQELHYAPGGGSEIGGLYASEGAWCSRCILPRITEAQADEVIAIAAQHYPSVSALIHRPSNDTLEPIVPRELRPHGSWRPRWNPAIAPPR